MRLSVLSRTATALLAGIVVAPLGAVDRPNFNRAYDQPAAAISAAAAAKAPGAVASRDGESGPARFIWSAGKNQRAAAGSTPEQAARFYLGQHAAHYGVGADSLSMVELKRILDTGRGGILAVFGQRVAGIPIANARVSVLMKRDLSLVALGGGIVPASAVAKSANVASAFRYTAEQALDAAFFDLFERSSQGAWMREAEKDGAAVYRLHDTAAAELEVSPWGPSRVWKIWYAMPGGLVPAWKTEILANDANGDASFEHVVSAADGSLLSRRNLTADAEAPEGGPTVAYTVWADTTGLKAPYDGPISDVTPHPTGIPDGTQPIFIAPVVVSEDGFNMFSDPWTPPSPTESTGNNVDAYADLAPPDGFGAGDTRAATTDTLEFDYVYDTSVGAIANPTQTQAAIVSLFYVNNWLHDYFYDSGFDELGGNAQTSNYGRGGLEADSIKAESDDVGGTNNANMSTPNDGEQPRMQMFKWSGASSAVVENITGAENYPAQGAAGFGPQAFDVTDDLVLATDNDPNPIPPATGGSLTDGCQLPVNSVAGMVSLVDRGGCSFARKAQVATAAGAVGLIIANNVTPGLPPMGGGCPPTDPFDANCTLSPPLGISQNHGAALKADLQSGPVTVKLFNAPSVLRSGSLDAQIVAHEWGHYFHHRQQNCGTLQCGGMSEGWGDFIALHTTLEDGNPYDGGVYAAAIYSTASFDVNYAYFGIRRFPYSTDFDKNGLTFRHIADGEALPPTDIAPNGQPNSEVHNAGEIWASMMFEAYVALLTDETAAPVGAPRLTFLEAKRRMADYASAGLQMSPVDATFLETRDSILAAAYASDQADFQAIAEAFATRGAGSCAIGPPVASTDNNPITESFVVSGRLTLSGSDFAVDQVDCDNDDYLDRGETGTIDLEITNLGTVELIGATVSVSSSNAHVTFPGGTSQPLDALGFGDSDSVSFNIAADATTVPLSVASVTVTITHANTCGGSTQSTRVIKLHSDDFNSNIDSVEADVTTWTQTGTPDSWAKEFVTNTTVWHGNEAGGATDTRLETPTLQVRATGNLILEFDHRYKFEFSDATFWDGGVIEYSTDGGANWADLSVLVAVPYDGVLTASSNNPLGGRNAFADESAGYDAMTHMAFDLGTQLAGQAVKFRFRMGTDEAVGGLGWDIDNIEVGNISNAPFITLGPDLGCSSDLIFADGFGSGNTFAWSLQTP